MKLYIKSSFIGISFLMLLLVACSTSEEMLEDAVNAAENTFNDENPIEANYSDDELSFYLPENFEVVETDTNNVVLNRNNNIYIIFYNHLEKPTSKLHYESADRDDALIYNSFATDDRFGYIRILESDDDNDKYELQVGVGGVKITTHTTEKEIEKEAELLMKIGQSIIEANV